MKIKFCGTIKSAGPLESNMYNVYSNKGINNGTLIFMEQGIEEAIVAEIERKGRQEGPDLKVWQISLPITIIIGE